MPERGKFCRFKKTQVRKLGKGLQLTDYNDLMNYVAQESYCRTPLTNAPSDRCERFRCAKMHG